MLLESGADVNKKDINGATALHFASYNGSVAIVESLVKYNAEIDINPEMYGTPLALAVENEHIDVIEYLIKNKADVNLGAMENSLTPLHIATLNESFGIVNILLENEIDVNRATLNGGYTALHFAAKSGSLDIVQNLIKNKADVNLGTMEYGDTPLMIALMYKNNEIVKILLENGADVNKITQNEQTALHFFVEFGYLEIAQDLIIKLKADVNQNAPKFGTPLIVATKYEHFDVIQCLVQNNAKINSCSADGYSALHWAIMETNSSEILTYLIQNGANVNMNTEIGSPLHFAASFGYLEKIKILILHGANVNVLKEDNGFSPLHEAVEDNHFEVCKYLISHGANVNQITKNGLSAYDIAILNGQILLAEFLSKNHDLEIISLQ